MGRETHFPGLTEVGPNAAGTKFARAENGKGILFKPRKGNAVVWINLSMNGSGGPRLSYASLPVRSGTKIGLNIFSLLLFGSSYCWRRPHLGGGEL